MNNELLWNKFLENIKSSVNSMVYATWFSKTSLVSLDNNKAVILVPLDIHKKRLNENYQKLIVSILTKLTGNVYDLDFIVEEDKKATPLRITESSFFTSIVYFSFKKIFTLFILDKTSNNSCFVIIPCLHIK